jgi:hypothetical protein
MRTERSNGQQHSRVREKHGEKTTSKKAQRKELQKHAPPTPPQVEHLELGAGTGKHVEPVMNTLAHELYPVRDRSKPMGPKHPEYREFVAFRDALRYLATDYSTDRKHFLKTASAAKMYGVDANDLPEEMRDLQSIIAVNPYGYGPTAPGGRGRSSNIDARFFESVSDRLATGGSLYVFSKSFVLEQFANELERGGNPWAESTASLSKKERRAILNNFTRPSNDDRNQYADPSLDQLRQIARDYDLEIEVERTKPPESFVGGAPDTNRDARELQPFNVKLKFTKVEEGTSRGVRFMLDKPRHSLGWHREPPGGIITDWVRPADR